MNVADFQQNKTMMRQHTHDFIKNTSKPRISRGGSGKGNNRAPPKKKNQYPHLKHHKEIRNQV